MLLNEYVSADKVSKAIDNRQGVLITYKAKTSNMRNGYKKQRRSDKKLHTGPRYIEPYVYGLSKANNPVIRAYQYYGDSKKGVPAWKLLRLDSIESWQPTDNTFDVEPRARGWAAQAFNGQDKSMSAVYKVVDLNKSENQTDLDKLRAKTKSLKQNKPVNISDIDKMKEKQTGPIGDNKPTVGTPNVEEPEKNTESPLNTNGTPKTDTTEPPVEQEPKQSGPIVGDTTTDQEENKPEELISDEDFMDAIKRSDMIKRNLELTRMEKKKRNVDMLGNRLVNKK